MLKLSQHTLFYDDYPQAGEYLVYNTRTQAIVQINQQARDFIERVTSGNGSRKRYDDCTGEEQSAIDTFKEEGFIINEDVNETHLLEHHFGQIKYHNVKELNITILTTYQCNLACVYCFEERVKQPKSMDAQTTDQIIEWLKRKVSQKKPESLRIMFYGGEPLINPRAIRDIAKAIHEWSRDQGTRFSCGMITNGVLLKKELIEELVKYGLTSVRVTLDGTREYHDKRRPYIDGRGSFDRIITNISAIADIVNIEVGSNFDKDNIAGYPALLDYLEEKGLNKKITRMIMAPVVARMGDNDNSSRAPKIEAVGCHSLVSDLAEEGIKLRQEVIQRGYNVDRVNAVIACPMGREDAMFVVDPYGELYKCPAFVGRSQFSVGNVRDEFLNHREVEFMTMNVWKECLDCVYVPMCGGGCRFMAQLKHSDCTKKACDIGYYRDIFPRLLKMDYERGVL